MEIAPLECAFRDCLESVQMVKNVSHQSPYQRIKLMLWLIPATKDMMGLPKAWNNQRRSSIIIQAVMPHTLRKVRSRNIWRLKGNRKNKWKDPIVFQEAKIINQVRFKKKEGKGILTILLSPLFYRYAMKEEIY